MTLLIRQLPLIIAALVVVAMQFEIGRRPTAVDAEPFHAAAAAAIAAIPARYEGWDSTDVPVPPSALTLLKPNTLLSRRCTNPEFGEDISLTLVQCRDTRDMSGHYPPICYPGVGWVELPDRRVVELDIKGRSVRAVRYEFERQAFDQQRLLVVYNFFAVPGQGLPQDMDAIRTAAEDYTARPFGAAQVQVALTRRRTPADERAIVESVLAPFGPVLDLLSDSTWRKR